MTIQEKADCYDEAIKVIKNNLDALNEIAETGAEVVNIQSIKNCFYKAFPKLRKSEDEQIREAILEHIQLCTESIPDRDKFIAWLEKQSNPKYTSIDVDFLVESYKQRLFERCKTTGNYPIIDACAAAFREGVENTLNELDLRNFINKSKENG